jgi:hypothetical protein
MKNHTEDNITDPCSICGEMVLAVYITDKGSIGLYMCRKCLLHYLELLSDIQSARD